MIGIWKRSELEKLMRKHGLRYSKGLGQNFLIDKNTLDKIVDAARLSPEDHILEIGPGTGALTVLLAQSILSKTKRDGFSDKGDVSSVLWMDHQAGCVTAVEIDRRLIPALEEVTEGLTNVQIVNEDFLKFDLKSYYNTYCRCETVNNDKQKETTQNLKIIGNLPYNITTPIIAKLLEGGVSFSCAVLMMQKEVAERLISPPGKKAYGAISVLVQYYTEAECLFYVSREVFVPKPGVDSAVIRLYPKDISADDPETAARMFRLVRAGFDMRRKILRNSLAAAGYPEEQLLAALDKAGVDPGLRAETLSPRDFYNIAHFLVLQ